MNKCMLIGNLTYDPDIKTSQGGTSIVRFTVAVQRKYKNKQTGNYDSDFIKCVAFKNTADIIAKHFTKGSRIGIEGLLHTDSYEKNGIKIPTVECWVDSVDFCFGATKTTEKKEEKKEVLDPIDELLNDPSFMPLDDNELPF